MGGENFLPDFTLFIQLGLFFVCYFFLKTYFFGPYLKLMDLRHEKTLGLKEKAAKAQEKATQLKTEYENMMKQERRQVSVWIDEERKKISDDERNLVQATRDKMGKEMKALQDTLDKEAEAARKELANQVPEYSSQIASKLLGRKVQVVAGSTSNTSSRASAETTV